MRFWLLLGVFVLAACQTAPAPSPTPTLNPDGNGYVVLLPVISAIGEPILPWWQPTPNLAWQIQLQGELQTDLPVQIFFLDLYDTPAEAIQALQAREIRVVCYFSAGTHEDWRPDADQFPAYLIGEPLADWPGERWLDIRRANDLMPIMRTRLDLAQTKGCDGVDPDNLDGYLNDSGFDLTAQDTLAYATWLANEAHARGLAIGLKNNLPQVDELEPFFDWVLNEECFQYDECDSLAVFITANKPAFVIEYTGNPTEVCPIANANNFDVLFKPLDLTAERTACR